MKIINEGICAEKMNEIVDSPYNTNKCIKKRYKKIIEKIERKILKAARKSRYGCKYFISDNAFIYNNINEYDYYMKKIKKYFIKRGFIVSTEEVVENLPYDQYDQYTAYQEEYQEGRHGVNLIITWKKLNRREFESNIMTLITNSLKENTGEISFISLYPIEFVKKSVKNIFEQAYPSLKVIVISHSTGVINKNMEHAYNIKYEKISDSNEEVKVLSPGLERVKKYLPEKISNLVVEKLNDKQNFVEFNSNVEDFEFIKDIINAVFNDKFPNLIITNITNADISSYAYFCFGASPRYKWKVEWKEKSDNINEESNLSEDDKNEKEIDNSENDGGINNEK